MRLRWKESLMTVYEQILQYDVQQMAEFIYGLITSTEEQMLASVTKQGYKASIVSKMPQQRIECIIDDLLKEVDGQLLEDKNGDS